ncbi:MAG: F0F1 ATP synthase subunit epsilon [Roseiflexaceae bacterium]|jgi:F-type H+-transporting ATPase subunit epsilon|nr:MAG: F0F1 ATP synthase subunit epsilon [Chloroflexota bacterium]RLT33690.1 MAG: F0F1 ATP synthase subunit epsilon [Chloroflexota bacterium]
MPLHLEIVTAERLVLSDDVDQVNAPTKDGRVGILPRHMPLLTVLTEGELSIIKGGVRTEFAVFGGFMEVLPDRVTILADACDRSDEIDLERAEDAKRRAEERLASRKSNQDMALAEADLRRALMQIKMAKVRKGPGA